MAEKQAFTRQHNGTTSLCGIQFTQMQDWLAQEPVVIERGEGGIPHR